jgi:hypothetical protein
LDQRLKKVKALGKEVGGSGKTLRMAGHIFWRKDFVGDHIKYAKKE